jgi:3-hydroxyisobutyrate dehydrogenase-like beta-hydroxyacid dehydrogenase
VKRTDAKIGVIGAGVVGTTTGLGLMRLGYSTIFYDIKQPRLIELKNRGYKVASNIKEVLSQSSICFVCVNTPTDFSNE